MKHISLNNDQKSLGLLALTLVGAVAIGSMCVCRSSTESNPQSNAPAIPSSTNVPPQFSAIPSIPPAPAKSRNELANEAWIAFKADRTRFRELTYYSDVLPEVIDRKLFDAAVKALGERDDIQGVITAEVEPSVVDKPVWNPPEKRLTVGEACYVSPWAACKAADVCGFIPDTIDCKAVATQACLNAFPNSYYSTSISYFNDVKPCVEFWADLSIISCDLVRKSIKIGEAPSSCKGIAAQSATSNAEDLAPYQKSFNEANAEYQKYLAASAKFKAAHATNQAKLDKANQKLDKALTELGK